MTRCVRFNRVWLLAALLFVADRPNEGQTAATSKPGFPQEIVSFIKTKEAEARGLAKKLDLKVSPDIWAYFRTAQTGSGAAITNAFGRLMKRSSQYQGSRDDPTVRTPVWPTVIDVELAVEAFVDGDPKYCRAFGKGVIDSIPAGSVYLGGTAPGRGLVTAFCKSHA